MQGGRNAGSRALVWATRLPSASFELSPDPPIGRVGVLKSGAGRLCGGLAARESSELAC